MNNFTPASSTTKTGRHDIAEILLKEALSTKIHSFKCVIINIHKQSTRIHYLVGQGLVVQVIEKYPLLQNIHWYAC
jgi:hypothetical protein